MPTAILDLDFENLPGQLTGLDSYERALVLIRIDGIPIGQSLVSVTDGKIGTDDLKKELMEGANWSFWQYWLINYLDMKDLRPTSLESLPKATVAVCTRDRPEDLKICLDGLLRMPDDGQEILVIDSCSSTDATRRIVEGHSRVRYIREDQPGVNIARNRALHEANNAVVAFTDDDAIPDQLWLRSLLKNFDDPLVICVTGLTMPVELETKAQELFEKGGGFSRGFHPIIFDSAEHYPQEAGNAGASVNMAIRKSLLHKIGLFDETLGPGTPSLSASETEFFFRILSSGFRIVYDPAALCWHKHRRSWNEFRHTIYRYRVGEFALYARSFLFEREFETPQFAWKQIIEQLHSHKQPLDLFLSELSGSLFGPWAYLYSRWKQRKRMSKI